MSATRESSTETADRYPFGYLLFKF